MTRPVARWRHALALALCVLLTGFTSPSGGIGGTGRPRGGIGGTGVTAIGVIQRFGSIFVNGTEYHLLPATRYRIDGRLAARGALRRGDQVFVEGHIRDHHATAASVRVQHAVIGVIEASAHRGRVLTILGQTVDLTAHTVVAPAAADLAVGTEVAVGALARAPGVWQATRVHVLSPPARGGRRPFLIRGRLQERMAGAVRIGGARYPFVGTHRRPVARGQDVVARGWYREGRPVITAMREATTLADARGARILVAGYFHGRRGAWRYEGSTLRARGSLTLPAGRLAFVVAVRSAPDRFMIERVVSPVRIMSFGLPSTTTRPLVGMHPVYAHPTMTMPRPMVTPMVMHPSMTMTAPMTPTMPRP